MHHNQPGPDLHKGTRARRAAERLKRYRHALLLRAVQGAAYGASTTAASLFVIWLRSRF
ncbi:hypothetical protein [Streptomyces sp. NPDC002962]|uniref:hypothetical protein n=1 Tax=Streptomyces sp. NPDC002962 TaxID=3364674 RepID=UPI0036CFDEAB